jgi:hypothetical protein
MSNILIGPGVAEIGASNALRPLSKNLIDAWTLSLYYMNMMFMQVNLLIAVMWHCLSGREFLVLLYLITPYSIANKQIVTIYAW